MPPKKTSNLTFSKADKRKQSVYFTAPMLADIQAEAVRLDRSMSWVMQRAWLIARKDIASFSSFGHMEAVDAV